MTFIIFSSSDLSPNPSPEERGTVQSKYKIHLIFVNN
jgi:hypothetical protein